MSDSVDRKLPKWPFLLGDAALCLVAAGLAWQATFPLDRWTLVAIAACVTIGAVLAILPFSLEYKTLSRLTEAELIERSANEIAKAERVASQIASATAAWQTAQEHAARTMTAAREVSDKMAAEAKSFAQFMAQANDTEKTHLRIEVDKLRRTEGDWLQVAVRVFDHIYALNTAAARSGQPRLVENLTQFQHACHEAARRVGLLSFVPPAGEAFDSERHQLLEDEEPGEDAQVQETIAMGYTFQGRLLRPALVRVTSVGAPAAVPAPTVETASTEATATLAVPSEAAPASPVEDAPSPQEPTLL